MDIATGILALAGLVSDLATIGRTFVEVPRILANLQRDVRVTLAVISHLASLLRVYQPSDMFRTVNIVKELTSCINGVRPTVKKLLRDVSDVSETPNTTRVAWKRRFHGFRKLPHFEQTENEIRRQMVSFDRLRDGLNM